MDEFEALLRSVFTPQELFILGTQYRAVVALGGLDPVAEAIGRR